MSYYRTDRINGEDAHNYDMVNRRTFYTRTLKYDTTTAPSNETKITASDGAAGDHYGQSVAVGSNRIVVGAPGYNNNQGKVYVHAFYPTGAWSSYYPEIVKLTDPNGSSGDNFGLQVAVGNGRIVVGTYAKNSYQGAVFIYDYNGNLIKTLNGVSAGDDFGFKVAVGCGRIVVGAPGYSSDKGRIYIYDLNGTLIMDTSHWVSSNMSGDRFGQSVAVGCGRIVVGAPKVDRTLGGYLTTSAGVIYRYDLGGKRLGYDWWSISATGSNFGSAVAIRDGYILATDPQGGSGNTPATGIFYLDGGKKASISYGYGSSNGGVAVGCGRFVIRGQQATGIGTARVYHDIEMNNFNNYTDLPLGSSGFDPNDGFGNAVAVGYGKIVATAWRDDDNGTDAGAIYIYQTPNQTHFLDLLDNH